MRRLGYSTACLILFTASVLHGQQLEQAPTHALIIKNKNGTVCQSSGRSVPSYIAPPEAYLSSLKNPSARTQSGATFNVTYVGFSAEAQTAFQNAVNIWSSLIQSPVPINVIAIWTPLSLGGGFETLGSAAPITFYANFDGAMKVNVFYPIALAEKMAGKNLNEASLDPNTGDGYEIVARFNSSSNWDYSPSGPVAPGKVHLTTVVLHELGHGLGVYSSYADNNGSGSYGLGSTPVPSIFDVFVESALGRILNLQNDSNIMAASLTSGNVNFNSAIATANNSNQKPKLYAPSPWQNGSSISHLDQTTYSSVGNLNKLMRPQLDNGQITLNPGPIILDMFKEMGWVAPYVTHTPLKNTETTNSSFTVSADITTDGSAAYTIDPASVMLNYSVNGGALTQIAMTSSGGNTYSAQLPAPVTIPSDYAYYISLKDNMNRTLTKPGQIVIPGQSDIQAAFLFTSGPDTKPAHITHTPISFIKNTDTQFVVQAILSDNIGVQTSVVQYQINGVDQSDAVMVNTADSTYKATINVSVADGDVIKYRIKVTDNSVAQNISYAPTSSTFYSVNVVGLGATQDSYSNNFNSPTNDFFGDNLFSIATPSGFADGSINSAHPYPQSDPKDSINYVYELRIPIKLKSSGSASLNFDEIVLCEPGDAAATTWPDPQFYDYVIVEGSKDGGTTWKKLINGYDCRDQAVWVSKWNSSVDKDGNSLAVGDPSLFKPRSIDMTKTGYFKKGDVILIRFRLMSDQLASGWGWAIDNLKIQIDTAPPTILHNHLDFIASTASSFDITTNVTDGSGVKSLALQYSINNGAPTTVPILNILPTISQYTWTLSTNGVVNAGDEIEYKLLATDSLDNAGSLPATGSFKIAVLNLKSAAASYASDFNSTNTDFVGNFFSIATPSGFSNGAIHSSHPYPNGFGLTKSSSFNYILKSPIKISATNPRILFNEIVIAETSQGGIKDYVVVEGSKNKGATWLPFLDQYSSNAHSLWQSAFNSNANGNSSLFASRLIDMTQTGNFHPGDTVLIRFRLYADEKVNAWGWAIDNLSIQGEITGIEKSASELFSVYPNPVTSDYLNVVVPSGSPALTITDILGRQVSETSLSAHETEQKVYVGNLNDGIYIVRVSSDQGQLTKKIVIKR